MVSLPVITEKSDVAHKAFARVKQRNQLSVVAAALGWVMTPAQGNKPERSPPHVTMHLEKLYELYLEKFSA
jgi:hypothetical protein